MIDVKSSGSETQDHTHFGFSEVPLNEKQGMVDDVFHKVAQRYDIMNDLMSGGLHRVWKDIFVSRVHPSKTGPFNHLDVAGGTGDIAFRVVQAGGPKTKVTVLDINGDMLGVGRERAQKKGLAKNLEFVEANAESLPFEDGQYDAYTIAFGIRNVPRIERALAEAYRVLKRGGKFMCLEFSQVEAPALAKIYESYSFSVIPQIGRMVTGDGEPYRYLVESIRQFPAAEDFAAMIENAGFQRVSFTRLTGGIVAIHSGWKL
ncbi:2-octaprenyl-6-methoxy-1,4-benzoquinone methylase /demethylmenaquinone methyltransferase [Rhodoblastus acidophilus]|uniref:Ubiquinone/menaquinone biosynthesis C-methyltransferase UbiE n=1 Tax=Rhodoblastus acidophilus TaxID=1074 RepID=A0A212RLZ6_RHOAC|nr:bifunctional demethylmenaquinone methyltransferase/2-methoxy-6-polyprenyl-1,4-benzoquinol methylase UbiE [Rhodoblastus acidophilus]MCW2315813.1 demethylmenaquinone methyltransferase/2-methoxy-6-polyprenyl-1,4-benzoquinol methylase [Rhodoblastus acidophilus]PPQ39104.1 bifunctional demethylmenaquinone methyltransferase/2-methoxy-6-polyprenyl-1,4-benzoquinol methylase UbiE [Rhodoblastus acidophilus]RAI24187.1 bifunctional demethylmenaquinone methyltransferase/2-methoxy-6-polyprenyl-1,4-benzoquin